MGFYFFEHNLVQNVLSFFGHCSSRAAMNKTLFADPDWASLNLGVLICIECSGIHRQLGSHISRVRSLDLDEWPPGHLSVMAAVGNRLANSVWEAALPPGQKPTPQSSQEERERYIVAKYSKKEFLTPWPQGASFSSSLVDAVCRADIKTVLMVLARAGADDVNATISARDARTPLHLAASFGNLAITQLLIWVSLRNRHILGMRFLL